MGAGKICTNSGSWCIIEFKVHGSGVLQDKKMFIEDRSKKERSFLS